MTLEQSIRLNDGMSSVLRTIQRATQDTIRTFETLQGVSGSAVDLSAFDQALTDIQGMSEELRRARDEQEGFTRSTQNATGATNSLLSSVRNVAVALGGLKTITGMIGLADTMTNTTARLDLMNDGLQTTQQLQTMIYQSANDARGAYQATADAVSKLGLMAGDAFDSSAEIVAFMNQINKQFTIAGTEASGIEAAMLQLTQAMGSGVLRGEEYNSILEQAPNIIQAIADYMEVPKGQLKDMAADGQITADIVKNAVFAAADETNAKFNSMPMTWGQAWQKMKNDAVVAFQPVLDKIASVTSSSEFQTMYVGVQGAISTFAGVVSVALDAIGGAASFVINNWSVIAPIVGAVTAAFILHTAVVTTYNAVKGISAVMETLHTVAQVRATQATFMQTAAQHGLNIALMACPITWIVLGIIAIIAVIFLVVAAINKVTGSTYSALGIITGGLSVFGAFIANLVMAIIEIVLGVVETILNAVGSLVNFLGNAFVDPIGAIIHLFGNLGDCVLGVLERISKALDHVFGSNLASTVSNWRSGLSSMVDSAASRYGNGKYNTIVDKIEFDDSILNRIPYTDAFNKGYTWGSNLSLTDWLSSLSGDIGAAGNTVLPQVSASDFAGVADSADTTAKNTGEISDKLSDNTEELAYLRAIMEEMVLNRIYTTNITVNMENTINNSEDRDLDGIIDTLEERLSAMASVSAEGVYV